MCICISWSMKDRNTKRKKDMYISIGDTVLLILHLLPQNETLFCRSSSSSSFPHHHYDSSSKIVAIHINIQYDFLLFIAVLCVRIPVLKYYYFSTSEVVKLTSLCRLKLELSQTNVRGFETGYSKLSLAKIRMNEWTSVRTNERTSEQIIEFIV